GAARIFRVGSRAVRAARARLRRVVRRRSRAHQQPRLQGSTGLRAREGPAHVSHSGVRRFGDLRSRLALRTYLSLPAGAETEDVEPCGRLAGLEPWRPGLQHEPGIDDAAA